MAATALTRLRWHAARLARELGLAGQLGVGVMVVSAAAAWFVHEPLHAERVWAEASAAQAERVRVERPAQAALGAAEQLVSFEQGFVGDAEIPAALGRLLEVAARHRLRIDQAEFKLTSEAGQPVQRYAMALPVRGEYLAVRRFVLEAMREQAGLALEELSLRRADPRAQTLEAQLRFVLFVRKSRRDTASADDPVATR